MYRIHFKSFGGFFCIQVLFMGMIWISVRDDQKKIVRCLTHSAAIKAVTDLGLATLYENKSADQFREHMQGQRQGILLANCGNSSPFQ